MPDDPRTPRGSDEFLKRIGAQALERIDKNVPPAWHHTRDGVEHFLHRTQAQHRLQMTCAEEHFYDALLMNFVSTERPDLVLTYGGFAADRDRFRRLKDGGHRLVFYLTVGTHHSILPFRDMDLILTDSQATADLYRKRLGLDPLAIGKFVKPPTIPAGAPQDCVTMIGALPAKGAALFIAIAREAARRGLRVKFLSVQSRGNVAQSAKAMGLVQGDLSNIIGVPLQADMTRVWGRTKILLAPSLWHESGSRTVVEACSAGIPVLATDSGGTAELLGGAGSLFPIPDELKENQLASASRESVAPWIDRIEELLNDEEAYWRASEQARNRWNALDDPNAIEKVENAFASLIAKRAAAPVSPMN